MTLKSSVYSDVKDVFLNKDEFAEEIVYRYPDLTEVTITAVVLRQGLEVSGENTGRSLRKQAEVFIAKEDIASLDKQNDRIILNYEEGTSRTARIQEVLHSDEGMWHVLIGW